MFISTMGVSDNTQKKQEVLDQIIQGVFKNWKNRELIKYIIADLTSGEGQYVYENKNIIGSPHILYRNIKKYKILCNFIVNDINKDTIYKCKNTFSNRREYYPPIKYYNDDWFKIVNSLDKEKYGLLYLDLNGTLLEKEKILSTLNTNFDFLINFSISTIKRQIGRNNISEDFITDFINKARKKRKFIIVSSDNYDTRKNWKFILLTNRAYFTNSNFPMVSTKKVKEKLFCNKTNVNIGVPYSTIRTLLNNNKISNKEINYMADKMKIQISKHVYKKFTMEEVAKIIKYYYINNSIFKEKETKKKIEIAEAFLKLNRLINEVF